MRAVVAWHTKRIARSRRSTAPASPTRARGDVSPAAAEAVGQRVGQRAGQGLDQGVGADHLALSAGRARGVQPAEGGAAGSGGGERAPAHEKPRRRVVAWGT